MNPAGSPAPAVADRWIQLALLALLVWLPVPWGSHSTWARAACAALVLVLVLARLGLARFGGLPLPPLPRVAHVALGLWAAWLGWTALQVVPLPPELLAAASPRAFEIHDALRHVPGASPLYTLSVLPGATLEHWLFSAALGALFWLVLVTVARNRVRQRWLLLAVLVSGLGQALYAVVMTLSGWEFGFLAPKAHNVGFATGTFVNKNHLAAYLGLGLAAGTALVLADLRPVRWRSWRDSVDALIELVLSPRFRVRVMLVVMVIALVLTRSRMGNAAFFFALALCGSGYVLLRHRRYFAHGLVLFLSIFVIDLWIVSDRYGLERLAERIVQTDVAQEGRAAAFADMAPLVRHYPLFGSGLGTFAAAFSPQRPDSIRTWFDHAHNDHLEFIIEVGVPGYLLLAGLALLVLWHGTLLVRRRHDPLVCAIGFAGVMAVVCAAVHALSDFALRIPAIGATLVALMALALSSSAESRRRAAPGVEPPPPEPRPGSTGVTDADAPSEVH